MEVLREKVEEEEAAEREEAAEQEEVAERAERARTEKIMRPVEVRKEETTLTQETLRDLEKQLSEIQIPVSAELPAFAKDTIDISVLPVSYKTNTPKEEQLLQLADNFSRQYSHLCPDRMPLFLHPLNECKTLKLFKVRIQNMLVPSPGAGDIMGASQALPLCH
ncbi:Dynein regulatory complex subunit 7 [Saguinus oedipus]|uniref:Dynein regulatory complex subunit 7 n=1 Tax=Saguinus oedipus TaxID=9490 RepID=A0ABQ9TK86_SAGOE|nr:Dynein regulatory complex subunit 7 [Saguinus oedipus]